MVRIVDNIFLDRASSLAASIAFMSDGPEADEARRLQSVAMDDHVRFNDEELPWLERHGYRKVAAASSSGSVTYMRSSGRLRSAFVISSDGRRTFTVGRPGGGGPTACSSVSVQDAFFACMEDAVTL